MDKCDHVDKLQARRKTSRDSGWSGYEWSRWDFMVNLASPSGSPAATRRLCVVSRNPLMSGVFVAGLTTAVGARDELEIIVDRRQGDAAMNRPSVERRHRDHVVRALERDGFAFVLVPAGEIPDGPGSKRPTPIAPIGLPSRSNGMDTTLRKPVAAAAAPIA